MESLVKHPPKSIQEYRHNIQLLKYHLKKQQKINETLKYKDNRQHKKQHIRQQKQQINKHHLYSMVHTTNSLNHRTKDMGLALGDVFRMADHSYQGQITKEQFMKTIQKLKSNLEQSLLNQLFYAIDTNLNGMLSSDQYAEFLYAHGGCQSKEAIKFQKRSAQKLAAMLKKKNIKISDFLKGTMDPCQAEDIQAKLKDLKLNVNQIIILLKMWDPSLTGSIRHEIYLKSMQNVKQKDEKQIQNQKFEKGVQELCVIFRDRKINPIIIFEESQADGKPGITQFQLQQGLKKLLPQETPFQIRKWVNLINLNGDNEITRQQFISAIKSFYSIQQIDKFSTDYSKLHPELKRAIKDQEIPAQKIINELSIAIEDNGLTKTQVFHRIDINHNGLVDKEELHDGLKNLGINIGLIAKVLTVFDRDASGQISIDQWLSILGQDVQMESVDIPPPTKTTFKQQPKKKKVSNPPSKKEEKVQKKEEKPPKKEEKVQETVNKTVPNKTKSQPLKDRDKNKTIKASQKQKRPSKPVAKPKFAQDVEDNQYEPQPEQEDINIQPLEREVAELYGQSQKKVLGVFKTTARNKKGITQRELTKALNDLRLKEDVNDTLVQTLFEANIASNGTFQYQEWLVELPSKYNIEVVPQKQQKKQEQSPKKPQPTPSNITINNKSPNNQSYIDQYNESFQNESNVRQHHKRGEQLNEFKDVLNLIAHDQQHTKKGYKFSNYIGTQPQLKLLNQKYLPLSENIKSKGKTYKDNTFPTTLASLTDVNPSSSGIQHVSLLKWKHYSQVFQKPSLFNKGIQPNDICQGQLGDCYFLCSLASLAQYNNLIQRIFEYYDVSNGYFLVWLCIDGIWKLIQIDGYIPVKPDGKAAVFSRCRQGDQELWVILLEKAYAKAYGCYEHIIGGQPYEAIKDLTGAPGQSYSHKNKDISPDILWQKLFHANQQKFMMTCGTDDSQAGNQKLDDHSQSVTSEGIVIGHAYSILDLASFKGQKLIQLRNPWGTMEWKGAWSDQSNKWTPQARKVLNYTDSKDDGIFWMPYETYYKYYATTAINYIRPNYNYTSQTKHNIQHLVIRIQSSSIQHAFMMVAQSDHRKKGLPPNTPYNMCHLIGANYKNNRILKKISDEKYMYQRQGSIEINSADGAQGSEFIVLINLEKPTTINLCTYADRQFQYKVDDSYQSMLDYIQAVAVMEELAKNVQGNDRFKSWLTSVGSFAFQVFKNVTKSTLQFIVQLQRPGNLQLLGDKSVKMKIKAGETQTLKGKIIEMKQSFSFGPMKFSFMS